MLHTAIKLAMPEILQALEITEFDGITATPKSKRIRVTAKDTNEPPTGSDA